VKSLCNIAQRCTEMFRTDFERICLDYARKLSPNDAWVLVQYGNHLKRIGDDEAGVLSASVYECFRGVGYDWLSKQ
jgi:hypothetical protein